MGYMSIYEDMSRRLLGRPCGCHCCGPPGVQAPELRVRAAGATARGQLEGVLLKLRRPDLHLGPERRPPRVTDGRKPRDLTASERFRFIQLFGCNCFWNCGTLFNRAISPTTIKVIIFILLTPFLKHIDRDFHGYDHSIFPLLHQKYTGRRECNVVECCWVNWGAAC